MAFFQGRQKLALVFLNSQDYITEKNQRTLYCGRYLYLLNLPYARLWCELYSHCEGAYVCNDLLICWRILLDIIYALINVGFTIEQWLLMCGPQNRRELLQGLRQFPWLRREVLLLHLACSLLCFPRIFKTSIFQFGRPNRGLVYHAPH
jgi:hypothetical protein